MEELKKVYVEKCRDFVCEPVHRLLEQIESGKVLQDSAINLNGNSKPLFNQRLAYMQVFALMESLHDDNGVKAIDLSYNQVDNPGSATIARLLKFNHTLTVLNLQGNDITEDGAVLLATALSTPGGGGGGILSLNLSGNPIGEGGGKAMADMLRVNKTLGSLELGRCRLGHQAIIAIVVALAEANTTLCSLNLGSPILAVGENKATHHIASMLSRNSALTSLNLEGHRLRDDGLDTLVSYGLVRNAGALTSLNLRSNQITEEGGGALERALREMPSLRVLCIASNSLGDRGAIAVAAGLPAARSLAWLDAAVIGASEVGLLAIASAAAKSYALRRLLLWGNEFGQESPRMFLEILQDRKSQLVTDFKPYEVDGQMHVAKVDNDDI